MEAVQRDLAFAVTVIEFFPKKVFLSEASKESA